MARFITKVTRNKRRIKREKRDLLRAKKETKKFAKLHQE
jgi:hypothetical protein